MLHPDLGVILGLRLTTGDISTSPRLSSGIHQEPSISWDLHTSSQHWVRHLPLPLQLDDDRLLFLTEASHCPELRVTGRQEVRPGVRHLPGTLQTSSDGLTQPGLLLLLLGLRVFVVLRDLDFLSLTEVQHHQLGGSPS